MDYAREVLADSPFGWWRMNDVTTTMGDSSGNGRNGTHNVNVAGNQPGALLSESTTATLYNGTSSSSSVALDLSSFSTITIEMWLFWSSFANDDRIACEFTPSSLGQTPGGFWVDPNMNTGEFSVLYGDNGGGTFPNRNALVTRPTANVFHHIVAVLQRPTTSPVVYFDGVSQSVTPGTSGTPGSTFANSTLYLGSRGGTSLFAPNLTRIDEVAIYTSALSAQRVLAHYRAGVFADRKKPLAMSQAVNRAATY